MVTGDYTTQIKEIVSVEATWCLPSLIVKVS